MDNRLVQVDDECEFARIEEGLGRLAVDALGLIARDLDIC